MPMPLPPKLGRRATAADHLGLIAHHYRLFTWHRFGSRGTRQTDGQTDGRTSLNEPTPSVTGLIIKVGGIAEFAGLEIAGLENGELEFGEQLFPPMRNVVRHFPVLQIPATQISCDRE